MPLKLINSLILGSVVLAGCGGSSGDDEMTSVMDNSENASQAAQPTLPVSNDEPELATGVLQGDGQTDGSGIIAECEPDFDEAENFYTNDGREWFCDISGSDFASSDALVLSPDGTGSFVRFGTVYWNRLAETDEIIVNSPLHPQFVMTNIFGSNTVMQFDLRNSDDSIEAYDCILTSSDGPVLN